MGRVLRAPLPAAKAPAAVRVGPLYPATPKYLTRCRT
jgi:hypothetical protein